MHELLHGEKVLQILSDTFADAFTKSSPTNLARFMSMQTLVHDILAARVQDSMAAAAPYMDHIMQNAVCKLLHDLGNRSERQRHTEAVLTELESAISGCINKCVVQHVETQSLELPAGFQLSEDDDTSQRRSILNDRLQKLQAAASKISEFGHSSSGPFQSVPELVAPAVGSSSTTEKIDTQLPIDFLHDEPRVHRYVVWSSLSCPCSSVHAICCLLRFMASHKSIQQ